MRCILLIACLALASVLRAEDSPTLPGFAVSASYPEQFRWLHAATGVRTFVNAPLKRSDLPRTLVIYATPNGNSIEQTLGARIPNAPRKDRSEPDAPGRSDASDFRFDIQHIAAQLRALRQRDDHQEWLLAVTDCAGRSWPSFRQTEPHANRKIGRQVHELRDLVDADQLVLAGHSGGGSFLFGVIESVDALPPSLARIIFLDANYAYDDALHGQKLISWLKGDPNRYLVVIAYDDREIMLDGKKVVGPTGGTYRATERMIERFRQDMELAETADGDFRHLQGLNGQIRIHVHQNPDNRILHTALVGERNGLLHGLTVGGADRPGGFGLSGPRAYDAWIQAAPEVDVVSPDQEIFQLPFGLAILPRPVDAVAGTEFARQIQGLPLEERELQILKELLSGNVPDPLRTVKAIHATTSDSDGRKHHGTYFVMPDYVAVGSNEDFLRVPLTPHSAAELADSWQASLITTKVSDDIFAAAELRITPQPMTDDRESVATFMQHHRRIQSQWNLARPNLLVAGIKKDVVLTRQLDPTNDRVAIYGWHQPDGTPIQPLYVKHQCTYVDYSHGIRLMANKMWVDGRAMRVDQVLQDPNLSALLSDEGPFRAPHPLTKRQEGK